MLSRSLQALVWQRKARAKLFDDIIAYSEANKNDLGAKERKLLRSEEVAQIIELFFVFKERGLLDPEELREFVDRHNSKIEKRLMECDRGYTRDGVPQQRLERAKFSKAHTEQTVFIQQGRENTVFDQRSIGKILVELMSYEHCRKLVVLMAEVGLLVRHETAGCVYVSSNGVPEEIYKGYLHYLIERIQGCEEQQEQVA